MTLTSSGWTFTNSSLSYLNNLAQSGAGGAEHHRLVDEPVLADSERRRATP